MHPVTGHEVHCDNCQLTLRSNLKFSLQIFIYFLKFSMGESSFVVIICLLRRDLTYRDSPLLVVGDALLLTTTLPPN